MRISKSEQDSFPRFCMVEPNTFVVDSLCFITGSDLETLCKVLNSTFAAYYFFRNIAILDNAGMQMRQQFVEDIPIPEALRNVQNVNDDTIFRSFGLRDEEVSFIKGYVYERMEEILNRHPMSS